MTRAELLRLSLAMTALMVAGAFLLVWLIPGATISQMTGGSFLFWPFQLLGGAILGILLALLVAGVESRLSFPDLEDFRDRIQDLFQQVRPRTFHLVLISLGAGLGEEILFRAALQPMIGLVAASLIFSLAHGTWIRFSKGGLLYAAFLFLAGLLLGWIFQHFGLLAAVSVHAVYDYVMLELLRRRFA